MAIPTIHSVTPIHVDQKWLNQDPILSPDGSTMLNFDPAVDARTLLYFMYTAMPSHTMVAFFNMLGISYEQFIQAAEQVAREQDR